MTDDVPDPIDTSRFTDADWAALNKLKEAYEQGGQKAVNATLREIERDHLVTYVRIVGAFFPTHLREAFKDIMAQRGMTAEDLQKLLLKSEGGSGSIH